MNSGIVIIRTSGKKKTEILPWPQEPWYKYLNNDQRIDFIAKLDHLDKGVLRSSKMPQRASEI